jgi:glucosylceramidase
MLPSAVAGELSPIEQWVSTEDLSRRLTTLDPLPWQEAGEPQADMIVVDPSLRYQSVVGIGSSLEHSTCYNLSLLSPELRDDVLVRLLDPDRGIGMSQMRICIGTPDFTASPWYSYHDLPPGDSDPQLERFSIAKDRAYVLPILQAARRIAPDLKFQASPWSPPAWMKTNGALTGGEIDPAHFATYALYLAKFVAAYEAEGLPIYAITLQNEPQYNPDTYPTCGWTAEQQRDFVRDHLGPLWRERELRPLIWCFDHNFNDPGFAATVLADANAAQFVDGTAFHHYEGEPSAMSELRARFPDKSLYFTEGSTFGVGGAAEIIRFFRNWARCYNAWVTMIDRDLQPNPGPHDCSPTCIVLDPASRTVEYRFEYYMYGHFSKFIRPGAVRIAASEPGTGISTTAFQHDDGAVALVVANERETDVRLTIACAGKHALVDLPARSVATLRWTAP